MDTRHHVENLAVAAVAELRAIVTLIERRDRDLGRQIRRSASSVALQAAEGMFGRKGHRLERLGAALDSARETRVALKVAVAWGYVAHADVQRADDRLDHVAACLYKLTRR